MTLKSSRLRDTRDLRTVATRGLYATAVHQSRCLVRRGGCVVCSRRGAALSNFLATSFSPAFPKRPATMTQASPRTIPTKKDLWSRFIEGAVRAVETLCPPLERTLRWDFSDCGAMFSLEDECEDREAEGTITPRTAHVRDIHQEMGDFLPHAASAA